MLAEEASAQEEYLDALGTQPLTDELALELDDGMWVLDRGLTEGVLTQEFANQVRLIDEQFAKMSDSLDKSIWNVEALATEDDWKRIRLMAAEAVRLLPASPEGI